MSAEQFVQLNKVLKSEFLQPQQPPAFEGGGSGGSGRRAKLQAKHMKTEQFGGKMDK